MTVCVCVCVVCHDVLRCFGVLNDNNKNINCRSDWRGRQHRRLRRAANTLAPPVGSRNRDERASTGQRWNRLVKSHNNDRGPCRAAAHASATNIRPPHQSHIADCFTRSFVTSRAARDMHFRIAPQIAEWQSTQLSAI